MKFKNSVCYIILLLSVISCSDVNEKNTLKSKSIFELLNGDTLINQEVKLSGYIALDSLSTELIYIYPYQIDAENEFVERAIALEGLNKKLLKSCLNSYVHIQATFQQYERENHTYKYLTNVKRIATVNTNSEDISYEICFSNDTFN